MLTIKNLTTTFKVGSQTITAIDDISFTIPKKSMVGLVGESGSGKSVTALSLLKLLPSNSITTIKSYHWNNTDITDYNDTQMQSIRGKEIALIFQNPLTALNPVFTIGNQMIETICLHQSASKTEAKSIAVSLLKRVSIPDPETRLNDYPHQFSLGMCQRIVIAMVLSMKPKLIIADEATASLDVTIQAQVLTLLNELKNDFDISILMISHDLGVIAQHCDQVFIMYLGKIIETGTPLQIFKNPLHPYTQALISSIPNPDPTIKSHNQILKGEIPSPMHLPSGCRFHPRCPQKKPACTTIDPLLKSHQGREVSCLLYDEVTD